MINEKILGYKGDNDYEIERISSDLRNFNDELKRLSKEIGSSDDYDSLKAKIKMCVVSAELEAVRKDIIDSNLRILDEFAIDLHEFKTKMDAQLASSSLKTEVYDRLEKEATKTAEMRESIDRKLLHLNKSVDMSIGDLAYQLAAIRKVQEDNSAAVREIQSNKIDYDEFNDLRKQMTADLTDKYSGREMDTMVEIMAKETRAKFEENRHIINSALMEFEKEIKEELVKKVSCSEFYNVMSKKVDEGNFEVRLRELVRVEEHAGLARKVDELMMISESKVDLKEYDLRNHDVNEILDDISRELQNKASGKETFAKLKEKANIDDVNRALVEIHDELENKCLQENFNGAMDNQALINETICAENNLGKWLWESGNLRTGYLVPWEKQVVNTASDNYLWEREKSTIVVAEAGLYSIRSGFFAAKSPSFQILINGEPIVGATGGNKMINFSTNSDKKKVSTSVEEFFWLEERSRVSISFSGELESKGFLCIKKF